ncbi:ATP-binding protein [Mucilaginibacter ginsenosidivorans]|uniref:histidine kinase n=1 Tax=Mucilaginibacter ginsenosidivorans TaxID=398053 RepID=A0A5B8UWU0_9SPHI|nr:ATP-binding protein [Mucilaginibacter ginsenosidivorans]QEC63368.1 PAS domain S-box protein [Mucilaginibacter ginsenosidivorans]
MAQKRNRSIFNTFGQLSSSLIWMGENKSRPAYIRYLITLFLVLAATGLKLYFKQTIGISSPYLLYFGIVCLSAILSGIGPAIFAAFFSAFLADYLFIPPLDTIELLPKDLVKTIIFLCECSLITLLSSGVTVAYRQIRQNQLLFKAMIEKGTEGIVLTDADNKRIYVSQSIERIIGYTADEFIDMPPWALAHPDELPEMIRDMAELKKHPGKNISFVHRIKHKNGDWVWLENSITNLLEDEAVKAIVANFYNVSERILMEQKKDDFISIASHELKTPVTSLKASLQLLDNVKNDPSSPIIAKLVTQANRSTEKITSLIEQLLDAGRVNQRELHLNKTNFRITELMETCCTDIRLSGKRELVLNGNKNIIVWADEVRIEQVITNLVNNAVKYAPESDTIYLGAEVAGGMAKVSVRDTGPGIEADKMAHLFERYYRAGQPAYHNSGLGLGLYISSEIIKKHGGTIGVESESGKGATFWFMLPLYESKNSE